MPKTNKGNTPDVSQVAGNIELKLRFNSTNQLDMDSNNATTEERTPNRLKTGIVSAYDGVVETAIERFDLSKHAPKEKITRQWHSKEDIAIFLENLATTMGTVEAFAFAAIALLFNKGAANKGTPNTLSVEVGGIEFPKNDLLYQYRKTFGTTYIRRLAESMSTDIGRFSQNKQIPGDLARRINNKLLQEGEPVLTPQEAAWASSFHQGNDDLASVSERMTSLLAEDYSLRFYTNKPKEKNKQEKNKQEKTKIELKLRFNSNYAHGFAVSEARQTRKINSKS